ncbi:DUF317 domain-containing protein [Streptomyces sp. NPDC004726]
MPHPEPATHVHRLYSVAVRTGPAPATDTERAAVAALANTVPAGTPDAAAATPTAPEIVPAHASGPGIHENLLNTFLDTQGEWQKWRTWSDDTTHAIHESQTLRIEFDHEARDRADTAWTIAAYESPVGERLWHATATTGTPAEIMSTFLNSLASENAFGSGPGPVTEQTFTEATRPLADTGWTRTFDGHGISLTAPGTHPAGVRFDPLVAHPQPAWTLWGGNHLDRPNWGIHLSPLAPAALLQDLTFELAYGEATRTPPTRPKPEPLITRAVTPSPPHGPSGPARGR